MIKKTALIFLCLFVLFSCGKKADPKYNANKNNKIIFII